MDREDIAALNRARVSAGWSYLGALVPLVGWILGIISLSNLSAIDTSGLQKAKKRITGVKRLAVGGLILSTFVALLYGGGTYAAIRRADKAQKDAASAQLAAEQKSCEDYVEAINNKVISLNGKYPAVDSNALSGFAYVTFVNECENDQSRAKHTADDSYIKAVDAANVRCVSAAQTQHDNEVKSNGTLDGKDANGQPLYRLSPENAARIQDEYQNATSSCNSQFSSS